MNFATAAVFTGVGQPFEMREFPLPTIESGAILVKIRMATICGSDLHTWQGKRSAPTPTILGHEVVGEIAEMGESVTTDTLGNPLDIGDRITWTIMSSCGKCFYCRIKNLPQKCLHLFKYGHASCEQPPHLTGGLAEYIYLKPGTAIFKIPDTLADEEVVSINCALATVIHGMEAIDVRMGENVVVQGAGMLGLYAVALLKEIGARTIIVLDVQERRLKMAEEFGADVCINVSKIGDEEAIQQVHQLTDGRGADAVIEVCGIPKVLPSGVNMLGIEGRYLIIGLVFPNALATFDGYSIVTKLLTLKGIHNYDARHLANALDFIKRTKAKYPYDKLITSKFSLQKVDEAFKAAQNKMAIRVAVIP